MDEKELPKSTGFILIGLSSIILLLPLSLMQVTSGHEAQEGLRLRALLEGGQWLFPEGLKKPPLFYWLGGLIAQLRGGVIDVLSLRLPSGLLATFGVLAVFWLGRSAITRTGSFLAACILLTSPLYVWQAHSGRIDMTLCFFVTLGLLAFFWGYGQEQQGDERRANLSSLWLFSLYSSLALAVLSKGPVGAVLILLPIAVFLCWRREFRWFRPLLRPVPLLVCSLVILGWYGGALLEDGSDIWQTQILTENLARFAGNIDTTSPLYYVEPVLSMFAPWSLVLPFALWQAVKEREDNPGPFFLAVWWITVVLFFQFAAYKRIRYMLPAQPAAALLVGWWLTRYLPERLRTWKERRWWKPVVVCASLLHGLLFLAGVGVIIGIMLHGTDAIAWLLPLLKTKVQAQVLAYAQWLASYAWPSLIVWLCMAGAGWILCRSVLHGELRPALLALLVLLGMSYAAVYPSWAVVKSWTGSPQDFAHTIIARTGLDKTGQTQALSFIGPSAIRGFPVMFYLNQQVAVVAVEWKPGAQQPSLACGYYLVAKERIKELAPGTGKAWVEILFDTSTSHWPFVVFRYAAA